MTELERSLITERAKSRATLLLACLACLAFCAHFGATTMYLAPENHTKKATVKQVNGYLMPYFDQNWRLFAPDPMEEDLGVLVRVRGGGKAEPTTFLDITTPMLERSMHRAFGDRLARMQSGTLQAFQDAEHLLRSQLLRKNPDHDPGAPVTAADLEEVRPEAREMYRVSMRHLYGLAALKARERWGDGFTQVQVRIGTHTFPRFEDRSDRGPGEVSFRDLAWQQFPVEKA